MSERAAAPPTFAVGTGRSGTHFVARLLAREPAVASHHERAPLADAFQRWCVWNRLPVDDAGFLAGKAAGIAADRAQGKLSFEASPYLSLAAPALHAAFGARFLLLVRRPERVVCSFLEKGWFAREPERGDPRLALGYQAAPERPHHPFARLAAFGDDGARWTRLSRVGKLAHFWRWLNEATLRDFAALPSTAARVQPLERFDYAVYRELASWIGFAATLGEAELARIAAERPGTRGGAPTVRDWTDAEAAEFEAEVAPLAERLGYEWRVAALRAEAASVRASPPLASRVRALFGGG
jgi:hypothetical protein